MNTCLSILLYYFYRRHIRAEDGFSQKRCLAWFHEYTTPDEPDTLGMS